MSLNANICEPIAPGNQIYYKYKAGAIDSPVSEGKHIHSPRWGNLFGKESITSKSAMNRIKLNKQRRKLPSVIHV